MCRIHLENITLSSWADFHHATESFCLCHELIRVKQKRALLYGITTHYPLCNAKIGVMEFQVLATVICSNDGEKIMHFGISCTFLRRNHFSWIKISLFRSVLDVAVAVVSKEIRETRLWCRWWMATRCHMARYNVWLDETCYDFVLPKFQGHGCRLPPRCSVPISDFATINVTYLCSSISY